MAKKKVGRPPFYESAEELQKKIDQYFVDGMTLRKVIVGPPNSRSTVLIAVPTITGLVLYCGFCDRHSFYAYEQKPEFSHTIKKARTRIEREYEEVLQSTGNTGAIFALKNFGWVDKQEIDHNVKEYLFEEFKDKTPEELERMADELYAKRNGNKPREGVSVPEEAKSA